MKKINSNLFKDAMSKFATGVTVISINKNSKYLGKTVNSFASLSLKPPLILFSLDENSSSLKDYKYSNFIGINILSKNQKKLSNYFATKKPIWGNTKYFLSSDNVPLIKESVVNISSKKIKTIKQGDHIIFICELKEIVICKNNPLVYLNSYYL